MCTRRQTLYLKESYKILEKDNRRSRQDEKILLLTIVLTLVFGFNVASFAMDNLIAEEALNVNEASKVELKIGDNNDENASFETFRVTKNQINDVIGKPVVNIEGDYTDRTKKSMININSRASLAIADMGSTPCNAYSVALGENMMHLLRFNLQEKKVMFSKFQTTNANYEIALTYIDEGGNVFLISDYFKPNGEMLYQLDPGDYGFLVRNNGGSYGNSYTVKVNTSTPGQDVIAAELYNTNSTYSNVTVMVRDSSNVKKFYGNGQLIVDFSKLSDLEWKRILDLKWDGGWNYNIHDIYEPVVSGFGLAGRYVSDYVSSENAVIIQLGAGTGFMYNESKRNSIENLFHYNDPFGNRTPRRLTEYDVANYQTWLIYDLDAQKPIDFWSSLNWYYATATEKASFVVKQ